MVITGQAVSGNVLKQQIAYDPWGKQATLWSHSQFVFGLRLGEMRGYTGHTMVNDLDLIHMGGRTYNPVLGRFMQADPFIQAGANLQNYNRCSYVLNNPLSYTDPSGYFFKKVLKTDIFRTAFSIGIAVYTGSASFTLIKNGSVSAAYSMAAAGGFASGAVQTGNLRSAKVGALSSMAFLGVGQVTYGASNLMKVGSHAVVGGAISSLQGGKFAHGFVSAGITKGAQVNGVVPDNLVGGTIVSAIVGGTVSELTGGKFRNGAVTGAFQFVMNQWVNRNLNDAMPADKRREHFKSQGVRANDIADARQELRDLVEAYQQSGDNRLFKVIPEWEGRHALDIAAVELVQGNGLDAFMRDDQRIMMGNEVAAKAAGWASVPRRLSQALKSFWAPSPQPVNMMDNHEVIRFYYEQKSIIDGR
ncbi:RHS repeat-associated core domain-containing protein [Aliidiomarina indica]|uniref:RHS repeat-associated core domain-containing protein n=1 Tax=Aliidiomarina indica TaxID=2749147 RepID=UPI00188ED634